MSTERGDSDSEPTLNFDSMGLRPELVEALQELGYEEPTPVQRAALPPLLQGRDVLGQAATGTGKTAAFALPMLQGLTPGEAGEWEASALVVVPTRELAMQVAEAVHTYGKKLGVSVLPVYGGSDIGAQRRRLKRGIDVVVATPGRALDHVRRKTLLLRNVKMVVLDEADEMLDLGFAEDLELLLSELPEEKQTALFSATLPPRIASIAEKYLRDPVRIRIAASKAEPGELPKIRQTAYVMPRQYKDAALGRILDIEAPRSAIIFCRTRNEVERLAEGLSAHGMDSAGLHGGMTQEQRDRVLRRFKAHELELLIATDVAARGLHVEKLSHVINYDLPTSPEVYVHRIGRTGRAGKEGVAITLLDARETRLLRNIEKLTRQKIELAQVPTTVDLRARKRELTRATVQEALLSPEREQFRPVVEQLASETELLDVAIAAVAALHAALNPDREEDAAEIPQFRPGQDRGPRREERGPREDRGPSREDRGPRTGERPSPRRRPEQGGNWARLFVGLGRTAGLRPADLVGAIANEAGLERGEIGAIQITDMHSFVEVAEDRAADVIAALAKSTIRGRRVRVDRDKRGTGPRSSGGPHKPE